MLEILRIPFFLSMPRSARYLAFMVSGTIRILGIDTSLRSTGVGIVEARGADMRAIAYGRIRNKPSEPHSRCLENIFNSITELIEDHHPDCAAIEGAFFAKNAKTAMVLGQARGAAITACAKQGLEITEYSPRKVKQSLVGTGAAQKEQVAGMVVRLLGLDAPPQEDAADALAVAICHAHQLSLPEEIQAKRI
jgi:crossover junction endodeoxyribonuclease RuvC